VPVLGSSLADRDGIFERVVCRRVAFSSRRRRRRVGFIERDFTPVYLRQRNARKTHVKRGGGKKGKYAKRCFICVLAILVFSFHGF